MVPWSFQEQLGAWGPAQVTAGPAGGRGALEPSGGAGRALLSLRAGKWVHRDPGTGPHGGLHRPGTHLRPRPQGTSRPGSIR